MLKKYSAYTTPSVVLKLYMLTYIVNHKYCILTETFVNILSSAL